MILFRANKETQQEFETAKFSTRVVTLLDNIPEGSLVLGRYCLSDFQWVQEELSNKNCSLVNSFDDHKWISEMAWVELFEDLTPKTWENWSNLPEGAYVLKGKLRSKKFEWKTSMFAPTRNDVPKIASRLLDDWEIRAQGIVAREFIQFKEVASPLINDLPVIDEWRIFIWGDKIVSGAFYWACVDKEEISFNPFNLPPDSYSIINQIVKRVESVRKNMFYAADIAKDVNGKWWLIELNEGQQSGLSWNNPQKFYSSLDKIGWMHAIDKNLKW